MAIVQFQRNGQGYFDFDALLNVTSVEFVERVKVCVELYEKHGVEFQLKMDLCIVPTVYLVQSDRVRVMRFGRNRIDEIIFNKSELLEMVGELF